MSRESDLPEPQLTGELKDGKRMVHLPSLIADNFGIARSAAREMIVSGDVEINGEKVTGEKIDYVEDDLVGKEIVVTGEIRHVKFIYNR